MWPFWHLNQNFLSALLTQDCLKGCGNDALFIAEIFLCAYFAVALTQKKMVKYGKRLSDCASSRLRELTPVARGSQGLIIRPNLSPNFVFLPWERERSLDLSCSCRHFLPLPSFSSLAGEDDFLLRLRLRETRRAKFSSPLCLPGVARSPLSLLSIHPTPRILLRQVIVR